MSISRGIGPHDREALSAFYDYAEPFNCECRAFGRLQEAGHEELAVRCFGYVLLDEALERTMFSQFPDIDFDGTIDNNGDDLWRTRFRGRDGRVPPLRGILKEYGLTPNEEDLQVADFKKMLDDTGRLHQLGILSLDIATRQFISGRLTDFSRAITTPHFFTTPELNPHLTPAMQEMLEVITFRSTRSDYISFDWMLNYWNEEYADEKGAITLRAFPNEKSAAPLKSYQLRNVAARKRAVAPVDPRRYNWKWRAKAGIKRRRRQLHAKPPKWYFDCGDDEDLAKDLNAKHPYQPQMEWIYKDSCTYGMMRADYKYKTLRLSPPNFTAYVPLVYNR